MLIEIIKVTGPVSKGKWSQLEVAYKTGGKIEGKKFFSFKHEDVYKVLSVAKEGDLFEVETKKEAAQDGKEYWQWVSIAASNGDVSEGVTRSGAGSTKGDAKLADKSSSTGSVGRVTGSNYETPDERATRQRLIVRQSSITAALALMTHSNPKTALRFEDVCKVAEGFVDFVFEKDPNKSVMADLPDDIPE